MRSLTRRTPSTAAVAALSAVLTLVLTSAGAVYASHSSAQIEACAKNATGLLRIVNVPGDCNSSETSIHWSTRGAAGAVGPAGPAGPAGGVAVSQSCVTGHVVTGIDANGNLICTSGGTNANPGAGMDSDGDGVTVEDGDCDDTDAAMFPGNTEISDGKDNDCDGEIDEGLGNNNTDDDGDSWIEPADCDDTNAAVNPDAIEVADNIDNDCDGQVDEGI